MNKHNCEVCGCPVKVVGKTTMHYEIDWDRVLENVTIDEEKVRLFLESKVDEDIFLGIENMDKYTEFMSVWTAKLAKALSSADILTVKKGV